MAASRAVESSFLEPRGYPKETLDVVDSKYLCGRCELILKNPLQSFCGHRFCRECFDYLLETSGGAKLTCSHCVAEDTVTEFSELSRDQTFPDNALKREFAKLLARCQFPGCSWSGLFKDFEIHYLSCEFMPRRQLERISFQFGDGSFPEVYKDLHTRLTSTERFTAELTGRVDRVESDIQRLQLEGGSESSSARVAAVVPLSGSGAAAEASGAGPQASELKETEEKMELFEGIVAILGRELECYSEQTMAMERKDRLFRDLLRVVDQKSVEVDQLLTSKERSIADLEMKIGSLEQTSYDGILTWRINNFQQRRREAIDGSASSIYSPAFYTGPTGYKMCARIYLNGDGMGKGTHVSLFFVVMRGLYDSFLRWPFRQKVTLMFLDQNNREHITDSFRPDPTSSSFKRPTSEMNVASGCPLFMQLTTLDSSTHAYVRENTAFVRIVVSLDGLG